MTVLKDINQNYKGVIIFESDLLILRKPIHFVIKTIVKKNELNIKSYPPV